MDWDVYLTRVSPDGIHHTHKHCGLGNTCEEGLEYVLSFTFLQEGWTIYEAYVYPGDEAYHYPAGSIQRTPQWEVRGDPQTTKVTDPPIPGLITESPIHFPG